MVTSHEAVDFKPYLQSILDDEDYREWQEVYTPTTVEGKKPSPQPKFSPRLKLRVETVKPKEEVQDSEHRLEPVEQWEALAGLRQYAHDHVLLIGKPGSGKSTSLERLLWEDASNALSHPDAKIPVLVKLRRCTSTIEGLIQNFFSSHQLSLTVNEIEHLLNQGKLMLLLDGLNELPEAFRTTITNFRDKYRATTPMIVSTRDLGVGGTLDIKKTLKMLPLSELQMQEFVRRYLKEEGDRLLQQLKGDRLQKFAETPLLLWMLCRVFVQNGQVPANLGLAFREFTQLYDRQIQEDAPAESREQWPKLLRHLAFALMHDKDPVEFRLSMSREEAENLLTECLQEEGRADARDCAERWLQDLLDYHLIQPVIQSNYEEHIEFRHQLIQEYYAAEYLLRLLQKLSDEQLKRDYLNYLKWTEAIALMLALINEEEQALRVVRLAIDDVDLMLGARLAGEVKPHICLKALDLVENLRVTQELKLKLIGMTRLEEAISVLQSYLKHLDDRFSHSAVIALQFIGSKNALEILGINPADSLAKNTTDDYDEFNFSSTSGLLEAKESKNPHIRAKVADILGKRKSQTSLKMLLEMLKDSDAWVRCCAAASLGEIKFKDAIQPLIDVLIHDPFETVRGSAAYSLGIIGSDEAESSLIKSLDDVSNHVQMHASYALGKIDSPQARSILLSRLKNSSYRIRGDAARALGFTRSSEVKLPLVNALKDKYYYVRESAVKALGDIDSEDIFEILEKVFFDKDCEGVQEPAAIALANIDASRSQEVMIRALKHPNPEIRSVAAHVLWSVGTPASVSALLVALDDSHQTVRAAAARTLDKIGTADSLSTLIEKVKVNGEQSLLYTISAIQNRCKFYNYQIWQESNQGRTVTQPTQSMAEQSKYNFRNAQTVQIIENNYGQVIGEQSNYAQDQEIKDVLGELKIFLTQLQEQHPQITTETQALEVIDAEFTAIEHPQSSKLAILRKQLLNPERHLQATKATLVEVVKHYLEESIWAKAIITYLDKLSEEPNQGVNIF